MHKLIRILLKAENGEEAIKRAEQLLGNIVGEDKKYDYYNLNSCEKRTECDNYAIIATGWKVSGIPFEITTDTKEKLKHTKIEDCNLDNKKDCGMDGLLTNKKIENTENEKRDAYKLICEGLYHTWNDVCYFLTTVKNGLEKYSVETYAKSLDWDNKEVPFGEALSQTFLTDSDWLYIEDGDSLYKLEGIDSLNSLIENINYVVPVDVHY